MSGKEEEEEEEEIGKGGMDAPSSLSSTRTVPPASLVAFFGQG